MLSGKGRSKRREFPFYGEIGAERLPRRPVGRSISRAKNAWLDAPKKLDGGLLFDIKLDPFERSDGAGGRLPVDEGEVVAAARRRAPAGRVHEEPEGLSRRGRPVRA